MSRSRKAGTQPIENISTSIMASVMVLMTVGIMTLMLSAMDLSAFLKLARDKTGTIGGYEKNRGSQVQPMWALASLGSFEAERGGFDEGRVPSLGLRPI